MHYDDMFYTLPTLAGCIIGNYTMLDNQSELVTQATVYIGSKYICILKYANHKIYFIRNICPRCLSFRVKQCKHRTDVNLLIHIFFVMGVRILVCVSCIFFVPDIQKRNINLLTFFVIAVSL